MGDASPRRTMRSITTSHGYSRIRRTRASGGSVGPCRQVPMARCRADSFRGQEPLSPAAQGAAASGRGSKYTWSSVRRSSGVVRTARVAETRAAGECGASSLIAQGATW